jgi:NADPH2:quinone reductase
MPKAYILKEHGAANTFKLSKVEVKNPGPGEVLIRHTAIGVNHMDVHHRSGAYKIDNASFPIILGISGAGVVEAIGPNVDFKVGDRVAYATGSIGSYSESRIIPAQILVLLPSYIDEKTAAGTLTQGMLAHALIFRTFRAYEGVNVLVNGATGGVGHILCQWLAHVKIAPIGVVGNDQKARVARELGCKAVINYKKENLAQRAIEFSESKGIQVVYDCVGNSLFRENLKCLSFLGLLANYGDVSGKIENIDIHDLWAKSLYITRPNLSIYKANRIELVLAANNMFELIKQGAIKPRINTYQFSELPKIHEIIEQRQSIGSHVVLL